MADATSLAPPSPGLSATLFPNKYEVYELKVCYIQFTKSVHEYILVSNVKVIA